MQKEGVYIRVSKEIRQQKLHEQDCQCALCGNVFKQYELQAHHIEGFAEGGSSFDPSNVGMLCKPCHTIADEKWQKERITLHQLIQARGGYMPSRPILLKP